MMMNIHNPIRNKGKTELVIARCGVTNKNDIGLLFWLTVFGANEEYFRAYNKLRHIRDHSKSYRIRKKAVKRKNSLLLKAKRRCTIM